MKKIKIICSVVLIVATLPISLLVAFVLLGVSAGITIYDEVSLWLGFQKMIVGAIVFIIVFGLFCIADNHIDNNNPQGPY